jgi:hypothetical protein
MRYGVVAGAGLENDVLFRSDDNDETATFWSVDNRVSDQFGTNRGYELQKVHTGRIVPADSGSGASRSERCSRLRRMDRNSNRTGECEHPSAGDRLPAHEKLQRRIVRQEGTTPVSD